MILPQPEMLMNAKLVKSMTAIFHCMFGIIATADQTK